MARSFFQPKKRYNRKSSGGGGWRRHGRKVGLDRISKGGGVGNIWGVFITLGGLGPLCQLWFCQAFLGMPDFFQNNEVPISLGRVELFCLFVACSYRWKFHCYHAVLVGYGPACPKFSKITNQYLWKGLSYFVDIAYSYLHLVRYPLKLQKYAILGCHCQA